MRCKKCGRTRLQNVQKLKCWREYQLCGACNVIEHPEEYPKQLKNNLQYTSMAKMYAKSGRGYKE